MRRHLLIVNNIRTPYRDFFFQLLSEEARSNQWEVTTAYMSNSDPTRPWFGQSPSGSCDASQARRSLSIATKSVSYHLNPGLVREVISGRYSDVLLGGGWHQPTVAAIIASRKARTILWAEANPYASRSKSRLLHRYRRHLASKASAIAVPNRLAADTVVSDWGIKESPLLLLPNIVDPKPLTSGQTPEASGRLRRSLGVAAGERLLVWPARLDDRRKGFSAVLPQLARWRSEVVVAIAGDGPDREHLATVAAETGIRVRLLGFLAPSAIAELFHASDIMIMGSLADPNPLVVVEGLWAGLPMLLSDRCGNVAEAVDAGRNGYTFNPYSANSIQVALEGALTKSDSELAEFGRRSSRIAAERFEPQNVVESFFAEVAAL